MFQDQAWHITKHGSSLDSRQYEDPSLTKRPIFFYYQRPSASEICSLPTKHLPVFHFKKWGPGLLFEHSWP